MSGALRGLLLGSIAVAYLYLFAHAREPVRLDVGDPAAEAAALLAVHDAQASGLGAAFTPSTETADALGRPPLARLVFSAVADVAGGDIGNLRLFALLVSLLASYLLYAYASRLYDRRIGLLATTVFTTSPLWLTHADSIHTAPLVQCTAFLALWGAVRALETKQLRHYLAVGLGSFACLWTACDYALLLPVAIVVTIYLKADKPFVRGHGKLLAITAFGSGVAILATCLATHAPRLAGGAEPELVSVLPAIARRITFELTPFVWVVLGFHVIRGLRAKAVADAVKDTATWLLVPAAISLVWLVPHAATQPSAMLVLSPFYAIGSALALARMLDGERVLRRLAIAWLAGATLWGLFWTSTTQRASLDRDEVAAAKRYLATSDANDFVLSNLEDNAALEAMVGRHTVDALEIKDAAVMLRLFELTGADTVHAVMFTDPSSRLAESSLAAIAGSRQLWSVLGWPQLVRHKSTAVIQDYDQKVLANLAAMRAVKVLQLRHLSIYRIERADTRDALEGVVRATSRIDFSTVDAWQHELLGWDLLPWSDDAARGTNLHGFWRCRGQHCKTTSTAQGLLVPDADWAQVGQLLVRIDDVCDVTVTAVFAETSQVRFSAGGFSTEKLIGPSVTATLPARALHHGVNVIELENLWPRGIGARLRVSSLDLASTCASSSAAP